VKDFVDLAGAKTNAGQQRVMRETGVNQLQLGLAEAKLRSARAFLLQGLEESYAVAQRDGKIGLETRVNQRLATTWAIQQGRDVVDFVYNQSGATALYKGTAIERRFRDVHAVTQHVQAGLVVFETMGQALLGLPVRSNLL
jgi:alkylation response protein AidB-like acyl-CoA dehydrogenase